MRKRIYSIISIAEKGDKISKLYDWYIMLVSIISILPLMFRNAPPQMAMLETVTVYLLFLDYIMRWMTEDYKLKTNSPFAFIVYPVTPMAIMDILGLLPSLGLLPGSFMILRLLRLAKVFQYSKSCRRVANVFKNQYKTLMSVLAIAVVYIFISALVMFVHEPAENFPSFYDALYWATTALTTVGYGDIYPCTQIGKFISMISSFFGVAVIAMPAGVVTAGFMDELNKDLEAAAKEKMEKEQIVQSEKEAAAAKMEEK